MEVATPALIPLPWKLAYTAFMAVLVPIYLRQYGPRNFLYFCDVALLLTLVGIWTESALLLSIATVGILLPQIFWLLDFAVGAVGGRLSGMTNYMFDSKRSLGLRGLSLFHGWLPLLLLYLLSRTGYDVRALACWTVIASALLLVCYFFMPPPSPTRGIEPVNINYVHGLSDDAPQTWMPAWAWLAFTLVGWPLLLYWPAHELLKRLMPVANG
jgi:hypothetical protein